MLGAAILAYSETPWNGPISPEQVRALVLTWGTYCACKGRMPVTTMAGTSAEYTSHQCLAHQLGFVDVQGAVEMSMASFKTKVAFVFGSGEANSDLKKREMSTSKPLNEFIAAESDVDNLEGTRFIAALLLTPCSGAPQEATVTPGSTQPTDCRTSYFTSMAYFKERTKNNKVTNFSASSDELLRGLEVLVQVGVIKAVHTHQPTAQKSSRK